MAKKKTVEKVLNIDSILFNCRDYLRAARNSGSFFEKRDMMLTLVFLRFIGEKYEDGIEKLMQTLIEQGLDPEDENIRAAFFDDATFADGTYNLPPEARWSTIINTPAPGLNVALDTALQRLEEEDPQLKGCFVKGTFTARNLAANDIKKIVDEVNKISHKAFGEEKDLIGRVYEYFLKEFAVNATKEEGEFYTPHDVVQLIATMIEPYDGTLFDPCCGSGGMFIQSAELVKSKQGNLNCINIYGQEKEPATYRLAKMNLALRGISHNLGDEADSSFTHDLHKGLYFNYIMANPPFNLKGWYNDNLKNDARWNDYQTPPESNANYAWILHMLSHLKKADGVAGFLLANGALNDSDTLEIRKKLIQNDKVEAIIVLPRELFITTDISVTLWILNQNKKGGKYHGRNLRNREHEILFMDLRQWRENPVKGENKKKVRLVTEQIERAADIYHTWQSEGTDGTNYEVPELYRSVGIAEIESKGWTLTPSKYIEFIDHDLDIDYEKEMARIQAEMKDVMEQEKNPSRCWKMHLGGLAMGLTKYKLGELIELVLKTNSELRYGPDDVRGMTITKEIIPTKADVTGTDLSKFLVVSPGEFIYNPRTHGKRIGFGYNNTDDTFIISWNNIAFKVKASMKDVVLADYLFLHFKRDEWDREACFQSWGSSTEVFSWETLCDMEVDLPPLSIQQKYADIYNAMLANQQSYERGLEDLKLVCDAYIDDLRKKLSHRKLGSYISMCENKNDDLVYGIDAVRGISIEKKFIDTKANMEGVSLKPYAIVNPNEFAYVTVTSRNGEKISLARNNSNDVYICSSSYIVFKVNNTRELLPEYLSMLFERSEFNRYSRFNSWGSARETFDWEEMCDVRIPVPDIEIQQDIVNIFKVYNTRKDINEKLKAQIKDICPILIKGSIEEARKTKEA